MLILYERASVKVSTHTFFHSGIHSGFFSSSSSAASFVLWRRSRRVIGGWQRWIYYTGRSAESQRTRHDRWKEEPESKVARECFSNPHSIYYIHFYSMFFLLSHKQIYGVSVRSKLSIFYSQLSFITQGVNTKNKNWSSIISTMYQM